MTLYEINEQIEALLSEASVDEETGEVTLNFDALDALELERDSKIEAVACYIKNIKSDIDALKSEEKALNERRKAKENKAENLTNYLAYCLNGKGFETPKCKVSFRKSSSLIVDEETFVKANPDLCTEVITHKWDANAVKKMIKEGAEITGAMVRDNLNISVK